MSLVDKEKTPLEQDAEALVDILLDFAHAINPDINMRECYQLMLNEIMDNDLSINNAAKLGTLCKLTMATPQTAYDH